MTECQACGYVGKPCCPDAAENSICNRNADDGPESADAFCKADLANSGVLTCTQCGLTFSPTGQTFRICCPGALFQTLLLAGVIFGFFVICGRLHTYYRRASNY